MKKTRPFGAGKEGRRKELESTLAALDADAQGKPVQYWAEGTSLVMGKWEGPPSWRDVHCPGFHPHDVYRPKPKEVWVLFNPQKAAEGKDPWGFAWPTKEKAIEFQRGEEILYFREVLEGLE